MSQKNLTGIFNDLKDLVRTTGVVIILNKDIKKYLVTYSRNCSYYLNRLCLRYKDLDLPKELIKDLESRNIEIFVEIKDSKTSLMNLRLYSYLKILELSESGYTSYSNHKPISLKIRYKIKKDPVSKKDIYVIYLTSGRNKSIKIHTCIGYDSYSRFINQNQISHLIQKLISGR